uniref:Uncharacterized protein n=1 Tax=Hucho hucho TaxID=62062 RepID=A0A4W5JRM9_9TELE
MLLFDGESTGRLSLSLYRLEGEAASRGRRGRDVTHPPPEPPEAQKREEEPVEMTETGLWREAGTRKEARSWAEVGAVTRTEAGEEFKAWVGSGEESDEEEGVDILGTERTVGMGAEIMVWEGLGKNEAQEGGERFQAEQEAETRIKARTVDGLGATSKVEAGMGVRAKTGVGAVLGTEKETKTGARLESVIEVGATPGAEFEVEVGLGASVVRIKADLGSGLEGLLGAGTGIGADPGPRSRSGSAVCISRQESSETQPSLYRDIWSLRASLEQYASSDQSSTDRESIRSDVDSVNSLGGAAGQSGFTACLSQDFGDELEGEWEYGDTEREGGDRRQKETEGEAEYRDTGRKMVNRGVQRRDSEGGGGRGGEGGVGGETEAGSWKLLQMDSGYTSIEAPIRAPEELRLFGAPGGPRRKTASEKRLFFTSSGRKGSVSENFEAKVFQEEQEDEMREGTEVEEKPVKRSPMSPNGGQMLTLKEPPKSISPLKLLQLQQPLLHSPQPVPSPRPVRLRQRDYSIDKKTDALFNEFLRHEPRFDQQGSPLHSRYRSCIHLRKQWQRHKQYSDPGSGGRYLLSLERQNFRPLQRGDSAGYPLDTRYHSTLSRIASAADEEANEEVASEGATNEGAAHESTDVKESMNKGTGNETVANEDAASRSSDTLRAESSGMDPEVDNYNNNSSQAMSLSESYSSAPTPVALPEPLKDSIDPPTLHFEDPDSPGLNPQPQPQAPSPSISDKLSVTMEDRLFTGLWRTGQGQGEQDNMVGAISLSSSSEPSSPV